ncbi:MAG TPA: TolC family protein [Bryobacteraceae bacterium]|jgi:outer membrane protein TolC
MTARQTLAITACLSVLSSSNISAQSRAGEVDRPTSSLLTRPYRQDYIPPAQLKNNGRLHSLIRAGKLYITVQDAIAIALENNLDLEVARYGPISAEWGYVRAQAGGSLRGVPSATSVVNQATSGQGVVGSEVSAGLSNGNGNNGSGNTGGAAISQIGPVTPVLDPVVQNSTVFSHQTIPQFNTVVSQTTALVQYKRISDSLIQEGFLTGGYAQLTTNYSFLQETAPSDILNPSVAPVMQIYVQHNFLRGFGIGVNSRFIRVADMRRNIAAETFRSQVMSVVAAVQGRYWDVVTAAEDIQARQAILGVAEKLFHDLTEEVRLGAEAKFEIFRAEADFKTRQRELALALATKHQQDTLLKDVLSRDGIADPLLDSVDVVPLDTIKIPERDEIPPLRELVKRALKNRPDVAISKINDESQEILAEGTKNNLLPTLVGIGAISSVGLAGEPQIQPGGPEDQADPYFVGGSANAFGQIFRGDFKTRQVGVNFNARLHNRQAQADYGIDQLQLRQGDLITRRTLNQLVVDISNQMIALRQARTRYSVAVDSLALQSELLKKEQQRFGLGDSTISAVIDAQRSEATARSAEVTARATFNRARLGLEQTLGETLDHNHVSMDEASAGVVKQQSVPPAAPANAR